MGAVYEAENLRTGRRVAVKLLLSEHVRSTRGERFVREARAASRLEHANIVDVLDMEQDGPDGPPFIVQEFLDGQDLRAVLRERGRLDPSEVRATLLPVMRALAYAHARGIVHRDIKPENIFLSRNSEGAVVPKVIDFGVAKVLDLDLAAQITRTGASLGTPAYMSPEQARGDDVIDASSDVWAIGVVMYELLTGEPPFNDSNPNRVLASVLMLSVPRIESRWRDACHDLSAIVHRALEREPAKRYATMGEFADALAAWDATQDRPVDRAIEPVTSIALPNALASTKTDSTMRSSITADAGPIPSRSTRARNVALAGTFIALAAVFVFARFVTVSTHDVPHPMTTAPRTALPPRSQPAPVASRVIEPAPPDSLAATAVSPSENATATVSSHRRPSARTLRRTNTPQAASPSPTPPPRAIVNGAPVVGL
jgi:serine/threonine-protein kinase